MSALSKRLWLKEGLRVACCDDEGAALAFGELAVISLADGGSDNASIFVNDELGDCAVDDGTGWVDNDDDGDDDGDGDELGLKRSRSRRRLSFGGGIETPLMFDVR